MAAEDKDDGDGVDFDFCNGFGDKAPALIARATSSAGFDNEGEEELVLLITLLRELKDEEDDEDGTEEIDSEESLTNGDENPDVGVSDRGVHPPKFQSMDYI